MRIVTLTALGVSLVLGGGRALACSCAPSPAPTEALAGAHAVFLGKVLRVQGQTDPLAQGGVRATFQVERRWKGVKTRRVNVHTWSNSAMCGYGFQKGETYLVYAHKAQDGKLQTSICSRTRREDQAKEDLDALGDGEEVVNNCSLETAPLGKYGGRHLALEVTADGAKLELDCAHGTIDEPLLLDQHGRFEASGIYVREHGGPIKPDEKEDAHPALYRGQVIGRSLTLRISLKDDSTFVSEHAVVHGAPATLHKCL
jgi:hypothetical protein